MNPHILTSEVQDFINTYLKHDISKLAFKGSPFKDISIQELIHQIISKNKCHEKLPTWFATSYIYYPPKLNIEQTSSEKTAQYKASLINGNAIIDLTGGWGVDCFYFSTSFKQVTHCEIDTELSAIAAYNFKQLQATTINCINADGISYLQKSAEKFDWIYIDPSRRDEIKGKVFRLADCLPNVPKHLSVIFEHTNQVLIKTAPLLDISIAIHELQFVKEIHIVAIDNEVKEILFILMKNNTNAIAVKTINILNTTSQTFNFVWDDTKRVVQFSTPLKYLYEPNKSILKSACFNLLADEFKLFKIAQNTHLYTSTNLIDFPGTTYEVLEQIPYHAQKLKAALPYLQANIKIRNFPDAINTIKKKLQLKDGGNFYVFFTTNKEEKLTVLVSKKVLPKK
ncbi:MAG: class I SAM-dependent methyltransferase [Flavobacteriaceae bacterium]|nr:class I SAM-dependent methyltransferase [Flavobacteriaceae bacterium]